MSSAPNATPGAGVQPAPARRTRVALIGVSGYARIYVDLLREVHDQGLVEIVAVVIINPAEEAAVTAEMQGRGARIYGDYVEMLRVHGGDIEICLIPTGIAWHARMTIAALRAGAHVLVEKPLAGSMAEVEAIRAAERASGRFVAVGFQDIYGPVTGWLKRELCRGLIGEVKSVRFLGFWPRGTAYFSRNHWAGRLHADGVQVLDSPLSNAFGHFVNLCLFFAGRTPHASARASRVEAELFRAHPIDSFDTGVVRAVTAEGVSLWFGATHALHTVLEPEILIEGTQGKALWRHEQDCVVEVDGAAPQRVPLPMTIETRRAMFANVLRRPVDAEAIICDVDLAAEHMAMIEGIHRAAPIRSFPSDWVTWREMGNLPGGVSPVPCVRGLEVAMRAAFAAQTLLSDVGFVLPMTSVL